MKYSRFLISALVIVWAGISINSLLKLVWENWKKSAKLNHKERIIIKEN